MDTASGEGPLVGHFSGYRRGDHDVPGRDAGRYGSRRRQRARRVRYQVARRVRSGSVTVNGLIVDYKMPFGGFKQSGIGREGGIEGLENYFEVKTVYFG